MGSSTMTGSSMSSTSTADALATAESMASTATDSVAQPAATTPATGAGRQLLAPGLRAGAAMLGLALL
ncbi:MAG: hypothetical protein LQ345_000060 [Seirophora villosa]|nr:MAG: hypothetical protein LQ345_000060 [Seirophora villosa]